MCNGIARFLAVLAAGAWLAACSATHSLSPTADSQADTQTAATGAAEAPADAAPGTTGSVPVAAV